MDELRKAQAFVALCLLGTLLFNYPLLALFNRPAPCSASRSSTPTCSSSGRR